MLGMLTTTHETSVGTTKKAGTQSPRLGFSAVSLVEREHLQHAESFGMLTQGSPHRSP